MPASVLLSLFYSDLQPTKRGVIIVMGGTGSYCSIRYRKLQLATRQLAILSGHVSLLCIVWRAYMGGPYISCTVCSCRGAGVETI